MSDNHKIENILTDLELAHQTDNYRGEYDTRSDIKKIQERFYKLSLRSILNYVNNIKNLEKLERIKELLKGYVLTETIKPNKYDNFGKKVTRLLNTKVVLDSIPMDKLSTYVKNPVELDTLKKLQEKINEKIQELNPNNLAFRRSSKKSRKRSVKKSRKRSVKKSRKRSVKKSRKRSVKKSRKRSVKKSRKRSVKKSRKRSVKKSRKRKSS